MEVSNIGNLYIIVPCLDEEQAIPITAPLLLDKLHQLESKGKIGKRSRILFIDDGSRDRTWEIIRELAKRDNKYFGIRQSRNRGTQSSIVAGLMEVKDKCDIAITIDCDGQNDIETIDLMVEEYLGGSEVVYGIAKDRASDTPFKKFSAETYYRLLRFMGGEIVHNHADYRLASSKVLNELEKYKEVNLFLRGIFPLVGFRSSAVYYERKPRIAGKSKYSFSKMSALAFEGITSLSVKPLHFIVFIGLGITLLSIVYMTWFFLRGLMGREIPGEKKISLAIWFLGGVQLTSLGIAGEYIGKIYMEVKKRPLYVISERTDDTES